MKQGLVAAGAGAILFFFLFGGLWVGIGYLVPAGVPRSILIVALGFVFLTAYVWLLLERLRVILSGSGKLWRDGLITVVEVLAMLVSFAAVYREIGIIDNTTADGSVIHEFWTSLYYSVVTFTTLGYGDFYPQGIGRALASMQALTGYIVLGVLASTAASVVSPHHPAGSADSEEQDG